MTMQVEYEIADYTIDDDEEDMRYAEHILLQVVEANDYSSEQSSLFSRRELSISHKFIKVENFLSFIDSQLVRADVFGYSVHLSDFKLSSKLELEMFSQVATMILTLSSIREDFSTVCTVHDFIQKRNENFNQIIQESLQKVDSYNLKIALDRAMQKQEKAIQVIEIEDDLFKL